MADPTTIAWLQRIDAKLDTKADKADLVPLVTRLNAHSRSIDSIEGRLDGDERAASALAGARTRRTAAWKWVVGSLMTLPFGVLSIVQLIQMAR